MAVLNSLRALRRLHRLLEEGVLVCVAIAAFLLLASGSNFSLNMIHQLLSTEMTACAAASIVSVKQVKEVSLKTRF